jgi:hypothetical protein
MVMEMAQLHDCALSSRKHTVSVEVITIVYRQVPTTGNDSKEPSKTPSKINFLSHFSEISIS